MLRPVLSCLTFSLTLGPINLALIMALVPWSISICFGGITSHLDFGRITHGVLPGLITLGLSFRVADIMRYLQPVP